MTTTTFLPLIIGSHRANDILQFNLRCLQAKPFCFFFSPRSLGSLRVSCFQMNRRTTTEHKPPAVLSTAKSPAGYTLPLCVDLDGTFLTTDTLLRAPQE